MTARPAGVSATSPPLEGMRVLEAGDFLAAPVCAMMLADWGAEVIKVEGLGGDPSRYVGAQVSDDVSAIFVSGNRGKRSVALDLSSDRGRELLRELALRCDIVIHNRTEAQATAIGLDYSSLAAARPELIVGSVTAFGNTGPYARRSGLDLIGQAMSGMMSVTGASDGPPMRAGVTLVDFGTGLALAVGVLAAWSKRIQTGAGRHVTTSLLDVGLMYCSSLFPQSAVTGEPPPRLENRSHPLLSDQFATADGFVVLAVWDRRRWQALCELLELPALAADPTLASNAGRLEQYERIRPELQSRIGAWRSGPLVDALVALQVPCAQTYDIAQAGEDPHIRAVGSLYEEDRLTVPLTMVAGPLRLDGDRRQHPRRPPRLGEHTREVLSEVIELDALALERLADSGTIASDPAPSPPSS